jgi:hypothetical protein
MRKLRHQPSIKLLTTVLLFCALQGIAQDSISLADRIINFPDKVFGKVEDKAAKLDKQLTQQTEKYLNKLERQEKKLYRKLLKKDSVAAKELFGDIQGRYKELKDKTAAKLSKLTAQTNVYSSKLDSLGTAFNFIKENKLLNTAALNDKLQKSMSNLSALQGKLNSTEQIQRILKQRRQQLKEQLEKFGMTKQLKQFKKSVYYYQQQAREYKDIVENPEKLQRKLMDWAMKQPAFKEFFAKNSALASLFAIPGQPSPLGGVGGGSLAGLQTRASIQQDLLNRFGAAALAPPPGGGTGMLQQNMQQAQTQLTKLKDKVNAAGGTSGDDELPEGFKKNSLKGKPLLKRLEYTANVQTQKASNYFPVTTNIGLGIGYRPNEKSVIGIGASYAAGLGRGWQNIRLTHQGIGLRTYADIKLKGSFWIAAGYEQNYKAGLQNVTITSPLGRSVTVNTWQSSGLVGLSKVFSFPSPRGGRSGGGLFKKTKAQLLWDFLSYQNFPQSQPILFRIGYNIR